MIRTDTAARPPLARMRHIVESFAANQSFMGAVLVARGRDILLDQGYGFANLESGRPNSPATKFSVGSLTKQFTAASILRLRDRGTLEITDPVRRHLPDAPAAWDGITIFNLLTQTSGIPNFTAFAGHASLESRPASPAQLVARFRDRPLDFAPGSAWSYGNSGYVLLGHLIERITGRSYAGFVRDEIFAPLGMIDSDYDSPSVDTTPRASGYTPGPNGPMNAAYVDMSVPFSAGGLQSTTGDLFRWTRGLFGGRVISPASLKEMTTPFMAGYGFGVIVRTDCGGTVVEHSGAIQGFNAMLSYYPDDELTVAVLANVNGSAPQEIARHLAVLAQGGDVVLPWERHGIAVDAGIFERYVGTYELDPNLWIRVRRQGDHLFGRATGQAEFELFPASEREFFLKAADVQMTFVADGRSPATGLILQQCGRRHQAKRIG